jgi:hypothetical protein
MRRSSKRQSGGTTSPQSYRDKATNAEPLDDGPRRSADVWTELRAMARH